jgi:hypothetical protein
MRLAVTGIFRARWTQRIHDEWTRNLLANRTDIPRERLDRACAKMNDAVPDSLVTGYERFESCIELPDPNDRHVVAAAVRAGAATIVTTNLKHFPHAALAPLGIEPQHPDDFAVFLYDLSTEKVRQAAREHRAALKNPPKLVAEYLADLRKQGLSKIADRLATHAPEI